MRGSLNDLDYRLTTRISVGTEPDRIHPEYLVDGIPLVEILGAPSRSPGGLGSRLDLLPSVGWYDGDDAIARLLLQAPSDLPSGRYSILVCPLCGDPGCGVVSATITYASGVYVWSEFGKETSFYPDDDALGYLDLQIFSAIGPFRFDTRQYERVIREMQSVGLRHLKDLDRRMGR